VVDPRRRHARIVLAFAFVFVPFAVSRYRALE
jgi:hypothetical protein